MINAFLKIPINFKDKCLVYPPSVTEVISEKKFHLYSNYLTISQEQLEDELTDYGKKPIKDKLPTPYEYLLVNAYNNSDFRKILEEAFFFFIKEKITILFDRKEIWFCDLEKIVEKIESVEELTKIPVLREEDFFDFQNLIRACLGEKEIKPPILNEHPKIKLMKSKARYRDKIKAQQGEGIDLETSLNSICCMNMGLNPLNIGELSYAAVGILTKRYQEKEKYEIDVRSLIAGADPKKVNPTYWIRKL
jgi:hypothetical protein